MAWLYIKCYAEFRIYLIMVPYASIMPEYVLITISMSEHDSVLLNVHEYA